MSIPKRKLLIIFFLLHNLTIVHSPGCAIAVQWIKRLIVCMKGASALYIVARHQLFEKLSEKDKSVTIYTRNLQTLATKMFKVYKNLSPAIIADLFHVRQNNYNLRHDPYFEIPNVKSVYHGTKSLSNLGPRILNFVPDKLKQLVDIHAFKKEIKKRKPENCPCGLCKTYILHVGFIWSFKVVLFSKTYLGAVSQKLSSEGSFLRENAMTLSSSSALASYFFGAFSIGIFFKKTYFFFMHVYVDFKTFISIVFKMLQCVNMKSEI